METEVKIPFGYKQITGPAQKGDGSWDGTRFRKVRRCWPSTEPTATVLIRKCEVTQPEIVLGNAGEMEWSE